MVASKTKSETEAYRFRKGPQEMTTGVTSGKPQKAYQDR